MSDDGLWVRLQQLSRHHEGLAIGLDASRMGFSTDDLAALGERLEAARRAMAELEGGAIANPDEGRMVGHYWLRAPDLAPSAAEREAIVGARAAVRQLAGEVLGGALSPPGADRFTDVVVVGIGGSSLGPMLVCDALATPEGLPVHFLDNTDPDGVDRLLRGIPLASALVVVISKSGGTKETRNGMLEVRRALEAEGRRLGPQAVAITGEGSKLDRYAEEEGFLARLPMWDWVGGRTSVTSAVGLLPAALAGVDIDAFLDGAATMDRWTREEDGPADLLAASWYLAGEGKGARAMVMLPYKDRLALTSRYLQQLVMESLGKADDLRGERVHQGLTVYGNKGSTDQHAYVQQLLDGPDDFFATFIEVLESRQGASIEVEAGITSGDYLSGFFQGTRRALFERGRRSLTLTLPRVDARTLGAVIALYERAVGIYASLIGVNAYHQPGVESGKRAAAETLALQAKLLEALRAEAADVPALARRAESDDPATCATILRHLAANGRAVNEGGFEPWEARYRRA